VHLIERSGGTVTDVDGDQWRHDSESLVATNGHAHRAVLEAVRDGQAKIH
jgi:myo-inositol-1(or 4)-monophosphatase